MDTWNAPTVQSRQPLTVLSRHFVIQVDGKRGPGRPKMNWKQLTEGLQRVESSQLSTLMIETPGDLV